jgi:hypothetical protein
MQNTHKSKTFQSDKTHPKIVNIGEIGSSDNPRIRRIGFYHGEISEDRNVIPINILCKEYIPDLHDIYTEDINDKVILIECYQRPNVKEPGKIGRLRVYEKAG